MDQKISKQQLGLLGENLVCAHLLAKGWDAANLNISFGNFRNIDLICQNGNGQCINIQVKTSYNNECAFIGLTSKEAAEAANNNKIVSAWVFVYVNNLEPLKVEYYVLSRGQMKELISKLHKWYLYEWDRPASKTLEDSPAGVHLWMLQGKNKSSKYADSEFVNPLKNVKIWNEWNNIWLP